MDLNIYWADVTFLTCKANYSQLTQKLILCIQIAKGQLDINRDSIVKHSWWHRVSNLQPSSLELLCFAAIPSYRIKSFSWFHNIGPSPLNCLLISSACNEPIVFEPWLLWTRGFCALSYFCYRWAWLPGYGSLRFAALFSRSLSFGQVPSSPGPRLFYLYLSHSKWCLFLKSNIHFMFCSFILFERFVDVLTNSANDHKKLKNIYLFKFWLVHLLFIKLSYMCKTIKEYSSNVQ